MHIRVLRRQHSHDGRLPEIGLLEMITDMHIRVLIDASAQIMEMSNYAVAEQWLEISQVSPAVIYSNKEKAWVLYRNSRQVPMSVSAYL